MQALILAILLFQHPPSVEGWQTVTETHYEVKNPLNSNYGTVVVLSAVGSLQVFKNPALDNEFIFMVRKHPALTFDPREISTKESSRDEIIIAENYFQKVKQEKLKEVSALSDAVLLIRWKEKTDNRTGEKILDGLIENWLLKPNGEWIFEQSSEPAIKTELLSEDGLLVGFKFSLGKNYHILRLDPRHLGGSQ